MFVNTLAIRNYPAPDKTFIEFFREVKKRTLDAFDNQDYPFENLVENVMKESHSHGNPLFNVLFSFAPYTLKNDLIGETGSEPIDLKIKTTETDFSQMISDLLFTGREEHHTILLIMQYDTQFFTEKTIEKFERHFKEIISTTLANPFIKIQDIMLTHELGTAAADVYDQEEITFEF